MGDYRPAGDRGPDAAPWDTGHLGADQGEGQQSQDVGWLKRLIHDDRSWFALEIALGLLTALWMVYMVWKGAL